MATWYRRGWKVWKLLASTSVTSTGTSRRPLTALRPPKPAPMTTTRGLTGPPHLPAMATATSAATRQLFSASARLAGTLRPGGGLADAPEHERGHRRAADAAGLGVGQGGDQDVVEGGGVEGVVHRDRDGEEDAGVAAGPVGQHRGHRPGRVDAVGHGEPGGPGVEGREPVVAPAQHRHARRLQVLERPREVEEGLGAGAHRDERVVGDGIEVGGDVAGDLRAAVDAADAPGREDADARRVGQGQRGRRRSSRRTATPAATATPRSRSAALRAGPQIRSCSSASTPTRGTPSSTAVIAGTAPPARTVATQRSSASRLAGWGRPRCREDGRLEGDDGRAGGQGVGHLGVRRVGVSGTPASCQAGRAVRREAEQSGGRLRRP